MKVLSARHYRGRTLKSPDDTQAYLRLRLADRRAEVFGCLYLDNRHRIIARMQPSLFAHGDLLHCRRSAYQSMVPLCIHGWWCSKRWRPTLRRSSCSTTIHRAWLIELCELFHGTIDGTSVYPRVVVQQALEANAAAVILFHNHPSGVAEPSQADERITRRLKNALELIDVRVLDHFIVAAGYSVSMAARGLV